MVEMTLTWRYWDSNKQMIIKRNGITLILGASIPVDSSLTLPDPVDYIQAYFFSSLEWGMVKITHNDQAKSINVESLCTTDEGQGHAPVGDSLSLDFQGIYWSHKAALKCSVSVSASLSVSLSFPLFCFFLPCSQSRCVTRIFVSWASSAISLCSSFFMWQWSLWLLHWTQLRPAWYQSLQANTLSFVVCGGR